MSMTQTKSAAYSRVSVFELLKGYIILMKPRIAALLLFTAYAAAIVAADGFPSPRISLALLFGLGLSAGGAAAINMWYDRDIDAVMARTQNRPLPTGLIPARNALAFGIVLQLASLVIILEYLNPLTAVLSFAGFLYYTVVYTMWLKRRTPQNIVIGGGAGAFPPLVGWAAVTGDLSLAAIFMFLIIFFWTPSHFWALALYKNDEYTKAGVPMMPVVRGPRATKVQCVIYAVILGIVAVSLGLTTALNAFYLAAAVIISVWFLLVNIQLYREPDHKLTWAKRTFIASLIHLPAIFTVMVMSVFIR
ncbi:heme o synthase [Caenibacillus caldisaponilyticus]|uniref:heme o synthase n=1 Tax=Caenibacillus caldisaponilyticus TaxID=1674942 RepID=UPI0009883966|nr:heme o synthase [Caenibacillus caldisaponilyticus]